MSDNVLNLLARIHNTPTKTADSSPPVPNLQAAAAPAASEAAATSPFPAAASGAALLGVDPQGATVAIGGRTATLQLQALPVGSVGSPNMAVQDVTMLSASLSPIVAALPSKIAYSVTLAGGAVALRIKALTATDQQALFKGFPGSALSSATFCRLNPAFCAAIDNSGWFVFFTIGADAVLTPHLRIQLPVAEAAEYKVLWNPYDAKELAVLDPAGIHLLTLDAAPESSQSVLTLDEAHAAGIAVQLVVNDDAERATAVSFSHAAVAVGSSTGRVRVFERTANRSLFTLLWEFVPHPSHAVSYLAFLEAPSGDMAQTPQSFLLAASKRNTVLSLWNTRSHEKTQEIFLQSPKSDFGLLIDHTPDFSFVLLGDSRERAAIYALHFQARGEAARFTSITPFAVGDGLLAMTTQQCLPIQRRGEDDDTATHVIDMAARTPTRVALLIMRVTPAASDFSVPVDVDGALDAASSQRSSVPAKLLETELDAVLDHAAGERSTETEEAVLKLLTPSSVVAAGNVLSSPSPLAPTPTFPPLAPVPTAASVASPAPKPAASSAAAAPKGLLTLLQGGAAAATSAPGAGTGATVTVASKPPAATPAKHPQSPAATAAGRAAAARAAAATSPDKAAVAAAATTAAPRSTTSSTAPTPAGGRSAGSTPEPKPAQQPAAFTFSNVPPTTMEQLVVAQQAAAAELANLVQQQQVEVRTLRRQVQSLESNLASSINTTLTQHLSVMRAEAQQARQQHEAVEREKHERLLKTVAASLNAAVSAAVRDQHANIVEEIAQAVRGPLAQVMTTTMQQALTQWLTSADLAPALAKPLIASLQKTLQNAVVQTTKDQLMPSTQAAVHAMFQQVATALDQGLGSFVQQVQQEMQDQWAADGPQQAALQSALRELNAGYLINESQHLRQAAADFESTIAGTAKMVLTETVTSAVEAVQREALRVVKKVSPAGPVAGTATTAPAPVGSAAAVVTAPAAVTAPGAAHVAAAPAATTATSAKPLANNPLAALLAGAAAKSSSVAPKATATVAAASTAPAAVAPVATPAAAMPPPQSAIDSTLAKHLRTLVAASRFDEAFVAALEAQNLAAVHFVCELVDPVMLFGIRPLLLKPTTTLALIHQLSVGWDPTSDLQLSYMRRALQTMEAPDHRAREVLRTVALQLRSRPLPSTATEAQRSELNAIVAQLIPLLQAPAQ